MPTISMFFGIVIAMYYKDTKQHRLSHIHARYQDFKAVFAVARVGLGTVVWPGNIDIAPETLYLDSKPTETWPQ